MKPLLAAMAALAILSVPASSHADGFTNYSGKIKCATFRPFSINKDTGKLACSTITAIAPSNGKNASVRISETTNEITVRADLDRCIFYLESDGFLPTEGSAYIGNGTAWLILLGNGLTADCRGVVSGTGRYYIFVCGAQLNMAFNADKTRAIVKFVSITPFQCLGLDYSNGEEAGYVPTAIKTVNLPALKLELR